MNWYKVLKFSSYSLEFPKDVYPQIKEIVEKIINFYIKYKKPLLGVTFIGKIIFLDIYSKRQLISKIYITNEVVSTKVTLNNKPLAYRDRINGNIYFNIVKEFLQGVKDDINLVKLTIENQLIHELTHSVDPKIINLNRTYPNIAHRLLTPTEFDSHSKEIISYINTAYKNIKNKDKIKNWVISDKFGELDSIIMNILNIPDPIFRIIQFWKDNKPIFYRKLKQRIYNEVINNGSNTRQNQKSKTNNEK